MQTIEDKPKVIEKVAWTYIRDGKVLMARSREQTLFYCPGGKIESGETHVQALVREIDEELGVSIVPDTIEAFCLVEGPAHGRQDTLLRMHCYTADYVGMLTPSGEVEEYDFLGTSKEDLARTTESGRLYLAQVQVRGLIA